MSDTTQLRHKSYDYALCMTSQFYFCGIPFRLDTAPKCSLNCRYCFAMARGGRRTSTTLLTNHEVIRKKLDKARRLSDRGGDITTELLAHRAPVHFGGLSDPFHDPEASQTSLAILKHLAEHEYPVVLSTKNTDMLRREDVVQMLKSMRLLVVQVSFSTSAATRAANAEPNSPTPSARIECMRMLSGEGIATVARIQPLILPWLEETRQELIPVLAEAGCKHTVLEFLKLPVERNMSMFSDFCQAISWNAYEEYQKRNAELVGREWLLPRSLKWELLQDLITKIRECGMTYGSGDYGLNHLGDTACCCGLDLFEGFSGWFKGNFSNVIRCSSQELLCFDIVQQFWSPAKRMRKIMNSRCRLPDCTNTVEYLRAKWNSPGTINAPDSFLGVDFTGEWDTNGNAIYMKGHIK